MNGVNESDVSACARRVAAAHRVAGWMISALGLKPVKTLPLGLKPCAIKINCEMRNNLDLSRSFK